MASLRNRYSKSLEGLNAIGFVSPQVDYATTFTTFAAFVANAPAGTIGVFRPDLANTPIQTAALAAGNQFFIAQAVDGGIKKTPVMVFGKINDTRVRHTPYNAPVKQKVAVGWNGTSGTSTIAAPVPPDTNTYVLSIRDTSPATQPFPVQEGRVTATKSTATILDIALALAHDLTGGQDYEKASDVGFVRVNVISNGVGTAVATVTGSFNEGSTTVVFSGAHTLSAGNTIMIAATGVTYKVAQVVSPTVILLDRAYQGPSVVTAAGGVSTVAAPTQVGFLIEAIVEDTTFVVSLGQELQGSTVTVLTAWKQGAGAPWQVSTMEDQTLAMDGYTTMNAQWVADYGLPTKFSSDGNGLTYNQIYIQAYNKTESMGYPNEQVKSQSNIILASPVAGATPDTELITIFPVAV